MTKATVADPDEIRELLLAFLYDHHRKARGVKAQLMGVRDLQRHMKASHGFSQQEVASNLDYLVQRGWVREVSRERTFATPAGTVRSAEQVKYKISDAGIDKIEGESKFKRVGPYGGVNIANVQGVVVLGDKNVVHNKFVPLANELEALREAVTKSSLADSDKVAAIAEVQTIQSQLAKQVPTHSIIRQAWTTIERIVTGVEFADIMVKVGRLVAPFLAGGNQNGR